MSNNSSTDSEPLAKFCAFFEKVGAKRLAGLDESFIHGMNEAHRAKAWAFLEKEFSRSSDSITGLYLLDRVRAVAKFKAELTSLHPADRHPALRRMLESNRLLMLRYINEVEAEAGYIDSMTAFAESEFEEVRGEFANAVPITAVTRSAVEALKRMIGREGVGATLTSAITKLMVIHGTDFDRRDPMYKSISWR